MTVFSELKYWFYGEELSDIDPTALSAKHVGSMMAYMHCMKWTDKDQVGGGAPSCRMSTAELAAKCPTKGTCSNYVWFS